MPRRPNIDRFLHEREILAFVTGPLAGVDEAGRGPLAGPVVAAAVVLPVEWIRDGIPAEFQDLNDSKQLGAAERERYFGLLTVHPGIRFAVSASDPVEIDRINILQATHRAMNGALRALGEPAVAHALVDGRPVKTLSVPQTALVKGDSRSYSIAAASVLAKVTRDRVMVEAHRRWPGYGFDVHKGYPTPDHLAALERLGPSPIHRLTFAPLRRPEPDLFGG
jgi:ribonuclease HII